MREFQFNSKNQTPDANVDDGHGDDAVEVEAHAAEIDKGDDGNIADEGHDGNIADEGDDGNIADEGHDANIANEGNDANIVDDINNCIQNFVNLSFDFCICGKELF